MRTKSFTVQVSVLVGIALATLNGQALFPQTVSVRDSQWAFIAEVPEGWVQDRRSLFHSGIVALFLPASAPGVVDGRASGLFRGDLTYLLIAPPGSTLPVAPFDGDISPTGKVETASFQEVRLYRRTDQVSGKDGQQGKELSRLFGILDANMVRFVFLLSAPSAGELEAARPAMGKLIESFVLLGN